MAHRSQTTLLDSWTIDQVGRSRDWASLIENTTALKRFTILFGIILSAIRLHSVPAMPPLRHWQSRMISRRTHLSADVRFTRSASDSPRYITLPHTTHLATTLAVCIHHSRTIAILRFRLSAAADVEAHHQQRLSRVLPGNLCSWARYDLVWTQSATWSTS